jgi:hypothetical protein
VFAPHSRLRATVTPAYRGVGAPTQAVAASEPGKPPTPCHVAMNWARRLTRVFGIEIDTCTRCGGTLRIIASIEEPEVIAHGGGGMPSGMAEWTCKNAESVSSQVRMNKAPSRKRPGIFRIWPMSRYHLAVDKSIRKFSSINDMKAEELRYWQGVSARERMQAVLDITLQTYRFNGGLRDVSRLQRTVVRIQRR